MRAKEFVKEDGAFAGVSPSNPNQASSSAQLMASIQGLQKQIRELQKSSLQQSSQAPTTQQGAPQPKPGEADQGQAAIGTVKPGQPAPNATQQPNGQQPNGQQPVQQKFNQPQKFGQPAKANIVAPVVGQPPAITQMKIKQQLAQTQGDD